MDLKTSNAASIAQGANEATKTTNSVTALTNTNAKNKTTEKPNATETKPNTETKPKPEEKQIASKAAEPETPKLITMSLLKPALSLDETLKALKTLHRESIKRDNLLTRIDLLEDFEIALMEGADELEANHFSGCKLVIIDNQGRQFLTNTPGLIKLTADFIKQSCLDKLAEIEANIIFPTAA
jgi:hypothetical protein